VEDGLVESSKEYTVILLRERRWAVYGPMLVMYLIFAPIFLLRVLRHAEQSDRPGLILLWIMAHTLLFFAVVSLISVCLWLGERLQGFLKAKAIIQEEGILYRWWVFRYRIKFDHIQKVELLEGKGLPFNIKFFFQTKDLKIIQITHNTRSWFKNPPTLLFLEDVPGFLGELRRKVPYNMVARILS
jgi:hypothetical protein